MNASYKELVGELLKQPHIENYIEQILMKCDDSTTFNLVRKDWKTSDDYKNLLAYISNKIDLELPKNQLNQSMNSHSVTNFMKPPLYVLIAANDISFDYLQRSDQQKQKHRKPDDIRLKIQDFSHDDSPLLAILNAIQPKINKPKMERGNKIDMELHKCFLNCESCQKQFKYKPQERRQQYPICLDSCYFLARDEDGEIIKKHYNLNYGKIKLNKSAGIVFCELNRITSYQNTFKLSGRARTNFLVSPGLLNSGPLTEEDIPCEWLSMNKEMDNDNNSLIEENDSETDIEK
jgi:hypothetical protein